MSKVAFSGQRIKAPYFHCIPNDKSFCSTHGIIPAGSTNLTVASWLCALGSGCNRDTIAKWDGNALLMDLLTQFLRFLPGPFDEYLRDNSSRPNTQEYYMPRGSLVPLDVDGEMCVPSPQEHICHKPLPTIGNASWDGKDPKFEFAWVDTVYEMAQRFGLDWHKLCTYNLLQNCSFYVSDSVAIKIPVGQN
jgi:hypothetical protein